MLRQYPNVHRWEETTDVYHNVFLRLDRALHNLGLATARDFFQLAAHHVRLELLDLARHHRHHPELWPEPPDTVQLDDDPQQMQAWELIHDHIKQLPDEERVLFDLLYYHGLTQPEAARVLGKPLSTVKKHWQRARLRLMDRLGDTTPF